jgi:hypothetical protein
VDAAVVTDIDLAKLLLLVVAFALEADFAIPIGTRMPTATVFPVSVAVIITVIVVPAVTPPTAATAHFDELTAATAIDPQAVAIHAPALPTDTGAVRFLAHEIGVAPGHLAAGKMAVVTATANRLTLLGVHRWRGAPQRTRCHADQYPHPTCSNPLHR